MYKKKDEKKEDEGVRLFTPDSGGIKVSVAYHDVYKKFAKEVKRTYRVLFELLIEKSIICAEKTPTGYYIPSFHIDIPETKERVSKPKKKKKKKEKVIERKASKKFRDTWDILNWLIKDNKREKWVNLPKKEATSSIKHLIYLTCTDLGSLHLDSINPNPTTPYEGNNTVFKKAFDDMISEISKASKEKWKKETSREEALRLFNITLDIISVKETLR